MKSIYQVIAKFDYALMLPLLGKLPLWLGRPLSVCRAIINAIFDLDWRTLSLGHGYVRNRTYQAMCIMKKLSHPSKKHWAWWMTLQRYICMSREEVDCYRLSHINYTTLPHQFKGLEYLIDAQKKKLGVVLLHSHFDSLYIGMALLAKAGLRVNLMSTRITNDPRVPNAIQKHYSDKRAVLNMLFAPGKVIHVEDSISFFIKALKRGEIVMIACDGPATSTERSRPVQFLGGSRLMVAGPQFLAESTHSPIALYTCKEANGGVMEIEITKPTFMEEEGLQAAYSALEVHLLSEPWRWWSSDMLVTYFEADNAEIKQATSPT